jgi:hypothetical protein
MKARSLLLSIAVLAGLASDAYGAKKRESLIVASKVKAYIKSQSMMSTADALQADGLPTKILAPHGLAVHIEHMGSYINGETLELLRGTRIWWKIQPDGLWRTKVVDGSPLDARCEFLQTLGPCGVFVLSHKDVKVGTITIVVKPPDGG